LRQDEPVAARTPSVEARSGFPGMTP